MTLGVADDLEYAVPGFGLDQQVDGEAVATAPPVDLRSLATRRGRLGVANVPTQRRLP